MFFALPGGMRVFSNAVRPDVYVCVYLMRVCVDARLPFVFSMKGFSG